MAPYDDTTPATRFDRFNMYSTSYKKIRDHEIEVGILVPKELKPGKCPVIVKWHGGGLVTGHCLYPDWTPAYYIPLTLRNSAITILPNYRLLPEHTGVEITQDLADFWTWLQSPSLPSFLASAIPSPPTLDFSQVLVAGESAGGYMALMSGLKQPKGSIKAILAQYPMTNYPRCKPLDVLFDGSIAPGPEFIEQHLSSITPGTVISSAIPPARPNLTYALSAYGRYLEFFGNDEKLWPVNLIEDKTYMPATWIVHGDKDTAVSVDDTRAFAERWARFVKEGELRVEVVAGEDHGFDGVVKENETGWLRDGLRFVEENWLGAGSGKVPEVL